MLRGPAALAFIALVLPLEASASVFGQCAQQRDPQLKVVACAEASKSTSYPWILQWVYRELARAHRERGEIEPALASYAQSLAAQEHDGVRQEMLELARDSAAMPRPALIGPAVVEERQPAGAHPAASIDISGLTLQSDFTVFTGKDVPAEVRSRALRRLWALMELPVSCHDLCYEAEPAAPGFARVASGERPVPSQ